ncbi:LysM peptidoglycan-binding domain-containing protein [Georgenia ruanii]|uniref:LysM peptidoglycan-binding domain-containing protein n=1 Tax=Georgenia ruanii TaxID=348442 RepID=UPI001264656F|nr:hypothetical protein [Georgenia ruanii]
MRPHTRAGATVAVLAGAGLLAATLGRRAAETALALLEQDRTFGLTAAHLPDVVTVAVLAVGTLVAAWYAATAAVALAALATRGGRRHRLEGVLRRCGAPILRRALLTTVATGVGVAVSLGGAAAATVEPDPTLPVDLGWGAPDRSASHRPARLPVSPVPADSPSPPPAPPEDPAPSTDAAAPATPGAPDYPMPRTPGPRPAPAPPHGAASPSAPATSRERTADGGEKSSGTHTSADSTTTRQGAPTDRHVVSAGESLWAIAADHLPESATDAEIAAAWPQWYRANAAVIGTDPDLIRPGQLLQTPTKESS